ncbi:hypothetical protein D9613_007385 [Agrocybe pediades]|uniref:Uncharacterized protein n=1 Tax=Agrocybe pediades TaxID=84607 RepID=A0A8H4VN77_9AGAR|nr:hypothetical protein D9613_007385 [Agrocybe pediades]
MQDFPLFLTLLQSYLPCDFSSVIELRFFINAFHTQLLNYNIYDFLQTFTSVRELTFTTCHTFNYFCRLIAGKQAQERRTEYSFLRHLKTITFMEGQQNPASRLPLGDILDFLEYRISIEAPIAVVNLELWKPVNEMDLRHFEEFNGLKIVYRAQGLENIVKDKICGHNVVG